jgi:gramicidin S synthase 2/tyrocidine synthetase-3
VQGAILQKSPLLAEGNNIYKTGDLARWLPDGNIEFLGRLDFQVKIRGFRIEPGEIENRLREHEDVKEAVVLDFDAAGGDKFLCAYIVGSGKKSIEAAMLQDYLSRLLPDYMIPAHFIFIDHIPLNPNGKVDRKSLPQPEPAGIFGKYIPPRNKLEEKLAEIWSNVLNIPSSSIGIDANFFEMGGHSLKANLLMNRIQRELNATLKLAEIFKMPTIRGLSSYLGAAAEERLLTIKPAKEKEYYHLSSAQKRLYLLQQVDKENMSYNMPRVLLLAGEPDRERLQVTFRRLVERHEGFRTSFLQVKGEAMQKIHTPEEIDFKIEYQGEYEQPGSILQIVSQFLRPFDLAKAPLLRVGLIKMPPVGDDILIEDEAASYILIIDMHHIISDGTSAAIFTRDFTAIYSGEGEKLAPLRLQYKDYAEWQNSEQWRERIKGQESYWLGVFAEAAPVMELLSDYPRPGKQSFAGSVMYFEVGKEEAGALKQLAQDEGATLFMTLLAIYAVLLYKLSRQEDIVVGCPVVGRRMEELQEIIGMFINTVVMRSKPCGDKRFKEFLQEIKESTLAAFENQDYPFEELVNKVIPVRDSGHHPLFDTMFTLQEIDIAEAEIPGLKLKKYDYNPPYARVDLSWIGVEKDGALAFTVEYCTALYKEDRVCGFTEYFLEIMKAVISDREIPLKDIKLSTGFVDSERSMKEEAAGDFGF